jgi:hypothetical protein
MPAAAMRSSAGAVGDAAAFAGRNATTPSTASTVTAKRFIMGVEHQSGLTSH